MEPGCACWKDLDFETGEVVVRAGEAESSGDTIWGNRSLSALCTPPCGAQELRRRRRRTRCATPSRRIFWSRATTFAGRRMLRRREVPNKQPWHEPAAPNLLALGVLRSF